MSTKSRLAALCLTIGLVAHPAFGSDERPNFIFISAEDISPDLGCYGNRFVQTPNLDRLASQGARFTRCFTHAPVCAPSRSGMITGMYPTSFGTHHMRSKLKVPPPPTFTGLLRKAGYHVAWPGKTDFNFDVPPEAFTTKENWMQRGGPGELPEPFFAYINFNGTHESKVRAPKEEFAELTRTLRPDQRVDPAKVDLPPYYPDAPEVRRDVANYYELITAMDYRVGDVLDALEKSGRARNTIVVFWGDHGRGLPRGKRWCYDSGTRCPLIVRWPGTIAAGTVREELVAVVDFAPTFLTAAGVDVPASMQGQPFLAPKGKPLPAAPRKYVYSARDRMDERFDRIRSVRDERFRYLRNFHPELPYAQRIQYGEQMPTMRAWRRFHAEGKLQGPQALFFAPTKPAEEMYDTAADPHEVNNLAGSTSPEHQAKLKELRAALDRWLEETRDLGAVPEEDLVKRGVVEDVLPKYEDRKQP